MVIRRGPKLDLCLLLLVDLILGGRGQPVRDAERHSGGPGVLVEDGREVLGHLVPVDELAVEPLVLVVLWGLVPFCEPETVSQAALLMVDDLDVRVVIPEKTVPAHLPDKTFEMRTGLVVGVAIELIITRGVDCPAGQGDLLGLASLLLDVHDNVLKAVLLAGGVRKVRYVDVLFEIVGVHVRAPPIVASGAHIDVVVVEIGSIATSNYRES